MTTIRLLLSIAATYNWHIHQLDINTAFLHGDLEEELYMKPPPGMKLSANLVCKLKKSIYGLKHASRQWNHKLTSSLTTLGFLQSKSDYSLFTKYTPTCFTVILVYIDDLIVAGTNLSDISHIKHTLDKQFSIKDMGVLKYFLGFEIAHSSQGITLCQRKYCLDLLQDTGLLASKPASTPIEPGLNLDDKDEALLPDPSLFRSIIGKLLYLTHSRPDIMFSVCRSSQYLAKPTSTHLQAAHRIVRYLKNAPAKGLFFRRHSNLQLTGFSDSDWGACPTSRRSITGFCFFLGDNIISWKTKKQTVVSRSSSEAEYRALANTTCEAQWLLFLLHDFRIPHPSPVTLYCDNQSAIQIANCPIFHERTKHIEMDCHLVRDKIQDHTVHLMPINSANQVANVFTKYLHLGPFSSCISKLGLLDIHSSLRGGVGLQKPTGHSP
ncbi:uncharacterized mitochondrial protein AtMg00810-like [Vicia villosa]|uniref:uncharacterized mitochondrial protein AtMg00810-like n=1 Tax=Vicia villosa TaxID=3911 RepID=UPI00273CB0AD|nr:uncharacterized mitochondrial protein AtMg00810-like [Vicia villosa]